MAQSKLQKEKEKYSNKLTKVEQDLSVIHSEMRSLGDELNDKKSVAGNLRKSLKNIEKAENIKVSDHAIIRYMERMLGIDVEEIKNKILTDETRYQVSVLGDGKYPVDNKHFVVISKNTVVTVYPTNNET